MAKQIMVERELFERNGKSYFTYFIKGNVRGTDVRIAVMPPDKGGYAVLDIVFHNEMQAQLVIKPYEIKDEATGNVIKGNTFAVVSHDTDGTEYECPIKPFRQSDKTLLNMLLR